MIAYVVHFIEKGILYKTSYFFEIDTAFDYIDKYLESNNQRKTSEEELEIFCDNLELTIELENLTIRVEHFYIRGEED